MVRVSEKVGLSQAVYTNHSVGATAISRLSAQANGVEDRHIMARHQTSECRLLDQLLGQRWLQSSTERTSLRLEAIKLLSVQLHLIG